MTMLSVSHHIHMNIQAAVVESLETRCQRQSVTCLLRLWKWPSLEMILLGRTHTCTDIYSAHRFF